MKKKVLLIGGSLNQTKIVHAVGQHLADDYDCYYTPAYCDGLLNWMRKWGWLEFTVLGERIRKRSEAYILENGLRLDYGGTAHAYDLIVTTTDIILQKNLRARPLILIQEGMTDPEDWRFHLVKYAGLPRWLAGTAALGLSNRYRYFCVASQGYRDLFLRKGCRPEKVVVTGLPNFDHVDQYRQNDFPYKDFALIATSNARETLKIDDRQAFLRWAMEKAAGRPVIFRLHPNENIERATREIRKIAPDAPVFSSGETDHMIANCSALITQYSSCVYVGLALGKECHSYFDLNTLRSLTPLQNGGTSGRNIARLCKEVLEAEGKARRFNRLPLPSLLASE